MLISSVQLQIGSVLHVYVCMCVCVCVCMCVCVCVFNFCIFASFDCKSPILRISGKDYTPSFHSALSFFCYVDTFYFIGPFCGLLGPVPYYRVFV